MFRKSGIDDIYNKVLISALEPDQLEEIENVLTRTVNEAYKDGFNDCLKTFNLSVDCVKNV